MTSVPFGNGEEYAVVHYDRLTRTCIVIANSMAHLSDAIAMVNSLQTESAIIVAPEGTSLYFEKMILVENGMRLYVYTK